MAIELPSSAQQVDARAKADVQRALPESNPFFKNHWLGALITGYANRIYDFYLQIRSAERDNFPDTALGNFLFRWAAIFGKAQLPATKSSGRAVATGTAGSSIPAGTALSINGAVYESTASATIANQTIGIASINRSGQTASVITASEHNLANNVLVTISGATQAQYNVSGAEIIVTGTDSFEYQVAGSPATPATGSPQVAFTAASVQLESVKFQDSASGVNVNQDAGTKLKLQSALVGVDNTLVVDFGAIGGGTDKESTESLRSRTLDRIQNPVAHFNEAAITEKAKEVPGVTRVFVLPITPDVGQVTVYFMRDNDDDPIPTASEVVAVREKVEEIAPVNTDIENDLFVFAPTPETVDFTFSALSPDTPTMRSAIQANLAQFFEEGTTLGADIDEDAYRSAIFSTIDTETGSRLTSFALSEPMGDVAIGSGEIGVFGGVTFP